MTTQTKPKQEKYRCRFMALPNANFVQITHENGATDYEFCSTRRIAYERAADLDPQCKAVDTLAEFIAAERQEAALAAVEEYKAQLKASQQRR